MVQGGMGQQHLVLTHSPPDTQLLLPSLSGLGSLYWGFGFVLSPDDTVCYRCWHWELVGGWHRSVP